MSSGKHLSLSLAIQSSVSTTPKQYNHRCVAARTLPVDQRRPVPNRDVPVCDCLHARTTWKRGEKAAHISKLDFSDLAQRTNNLPPYFIRNVELSKRHVHGAEQGVLLDPHGGGLMAPGHRLSKNVTGGPTLQKEDIRVTTPSWLGDNRIDTAESIPNDLKAKWIIRCSALLACQASPPPIFLF